MYRGLSASVRLVDVRGVGLRCCCYCDQASSPFREPLLKFLRQHPKQTSELFLSDAYLKDSQYSRCFLSLLEHEDGTISFLLPCASPFTSFLSLFPGKPIRDEIEANQVSRLMSALPPTANGSVRVEAWQYQPISIIHTLVSPIPPSSSTSGRFASVLSTFLD